MTEIAGQWVSSLSSGGPLTILAFLAVHVAFATLFVPCSPLTLAAGFVWGVWPGLLISVAGASLSAAATFGLSRWARYRRPAWLLSSPWVRRLREPLAVVVGGGWASVILFQSTPLVPGSSLGYLFGLANIGFWEFLVASLVGMLPMQIVVIAGGALAYDVVVLNEVQRYASWSMLLLAAIAGTVAVFRWRLRRAHCQGQRGD